MTVPVVNSEVKIIRVDLDGDDCLTLTVLDGTVSRDYQIALGQARTLSLDLVRHACRAELRNQQRELPQAAKPVSFQFRYQQQA